MGGRRWWFGALGACLVAMGPAPGDDGGWTDLTPPGSMLAAWKTPTAAWEEVGSVALETPEARQFSAEPGKGVLYNGPTGKTSNLFSRDSFGDVVLQAEFNLPKGSNSGIKLMGLYEVQIQDCYGIPDDKITASHTGGIYPRAELLPRYHHIDKGYPPRTNASKAPGEWQTLEITFRGPRFDADGKKAANARFVRVTLNGTVVQEDLDMPYLTGHAWRLPEVATGPILLQADHGPVAFRNLRVRPLQDPADGR